MKMREHADDHAQPAEIIGQAVGFGREKLGFLDLFGQRGALGVGDFRQLAPKLRADIVGFTRSGQRDGVIIAEAIGLLPAGDVAGDVAELLRRAR